MRHPFRFLIGASGTAVMILSLVATLEIQLATARPGTGAEPTGSIDRALKGDRLRSLPAPRGEMPAEQPKLPKGCEGSFSSRSIYANEIAGRCVATGLVPTLAG